MNKQGKLTQVDGLTKVAGGIEWTKTVLPDGNEQPGYTWNPVGGCRHRCRWRMPDGNIAVCYAETAANKFTAAYPRGFEHHYWRPHKLQEPLRVKQPAKIFLDSMSDLMGHWVLAEQIEQVLDIARQASWHTFQLLTKNAPRLLKFQFPPNVWVGVSSPPDFYNGQPLSRQQQEQMLGKSLEVLRQVDVPVRWMSVEPLSWDVADLFRACSLQWVVIGAASSGPRYYQPQPEYVQRLLAVLDAQRIPVFFKGNLEWQPRREDWPNPARDEGQ